MVRINKYSWNERIPFCVTAGITLLLSLLLKAYYSQAEPAELQWILAPIAWCVSLVSGSTFQFNPELGYVSEQLQTVIAPVCAGVNFMIIVFGMSAVAGMIKGRRTLLVNLAVALLLAYFSTVVINSLRISLALVLYHYKLRAGWFTVERVHRLLGVVVYITALYAIYGQLYRNKIKNDGTGKMRAVIRSYLLPGLWYLCVTVVVPVVLGKYTHYGKQFTEHILFIVLAVAGVTLLAFVLGYTGRSQIVKKMESE